MTIDQCSCPILVAYVRRVTKKGLPLRWCNLGSLLVVNASHHTSFELGFMEKGDLLRWKVGVVVHVGNQEALHVCMVQ